MNVALYFKRVLFYIMDNSLEGALAYVLGCLDTKTGGERGLPFSLQSASAPTQLPTTYLKTSTLLTC